MSATKRTARPQKPPESHSTPDFRHYPLRGIFSEIAREKGTTRQAIQQALRCRNPDVLKRIALKIRQRRAAVEKYEHETTVG